MSKATQKSPGQVSEKSPPPGLLRGLGGADEGGLELVLEPVGIVPDVQVREDLPDDRPSNGSGASSPLLVLLPSRLAFPKRIRADVTARGGDRRADAPLPSFSPVDTTARMRRSFASGLSRAAIFDACRVTPR